MLSKIFLLAICSGIVSGQGLPKGTCFIRDWDENTSPTNPHTLSPQSDYYYWSHTQVWSGTTNLRIWGARWESGGHGKYIAYGWGETAFRLFSNDYTNFFTTEQQVRELSTNFTLECLDGTETMYYMKVPLVDNTAPRFFELGLGGTGQYDVSLPINWDLSRPITELVNITVCDNAFEIGNGEALMVDAAPSALVQVVAQPPVQYQYTPYRKWYCSRIDLYLKRPLQQGENIEINLSATDPFSNSATSVVAINVS